jgi:hypothetical protein
MSVNASPTLAAMRDRTRVLTVHLSNIFKSRPGRTSPGGRPLRCALRLASSCLACLQSLPISTACASFSSESSRAKRSSLTWRTISSLGPRVDTLCNGGGCTVNDDAYLCRCCSLESADRAK